MLESLQPIVFVLGVFALTWSAAYTDARYWKIPNALTLPAFALGWVYQGMFHGLPGLADGGLAFLLGFGTYFLLWMIGTGGGGDAKLIGALTVWLGVKLSIYLMVFCILFVIVGTFGVVVWNTFRFGPRRAKDRLLKAKTADSRDGRTQKPAARQVSGRILPFAMPVAAATLCVVVLDYAAIKGGQLGDDGRAAVGAPLPNAADAASSTTSSEIALKTGGSDSTSTTPADRTQNEEAAALPNAESSVINTEESASDTQQPEPDRASEPAPVSTSPAPVSEERGLQANLETPTAQTEAVAPTAQEEPVRK